jgi:hypothetical protein
VAEQRSEATNKNALRMRIQFINTLTIETGKREHVVALRSLHLRLKRTRQRHGLIRRYGLPVNLILLWSTVSKKTSVLQRAPAGFVKKRFDRALLCAPAG